MCTRTSFHSAYSEGWAGSGRRAGRSRASNTLWRDPGSFLKGRWLSSTRRSAIAVFSSRREKKVWWRRRARSHRSTTCTPTSTLALSRGRAARLVTMGPAHGGLEIIRDHDLGHPTERRKGADMGPDPGGETLAPRRFGEGIVGGAQDGDEDRGGADFPREGIDDRHRLARIVDKERLA